MLPQDGLGYQDRHGVKKKITIITMGEMRGEGELGTKVSRTYRVKRDRCRHVIGSKPPEENTGSNVEKNKTM
jgi:hypothetical protein